MTQEAEDRGASLIVANGGSPETFRWMMGVLRAAHFGLADRAAGEFVCRWIDVRVHSVPPEADTIIRTITRTVNDQSTSTTHWLEGLRAPPV